MTRAAYAGAVALGAALAVSACSSDAPQQCPGRGVGRFQFQGTLLAPAATLPAGLDPSPALTHCPAALEFPKTLTPFDGTLSSDEATSAGALCRATGILFGIRTGSRWIVEASSGGGAVLPACGSTCAASSRIVVSGDVLPDPSNPTSFVGAFVEQLSPEEGDCSLCDLPCAARYDLAGSLVTP